MCIPATFLQFKNDPSLEREDGGEMPSKARPFGSINFSLLSLKNSKFLDAGGKNYCLVNSLSLINNNEPQAI